MRPYDQTILDHYKAVAGEAGLGANATMADSRTRQLETELIVRFVRRSLDLATAAGRRPEQVVIADIGCGNGYTLEVVRGIDPRPRLVGFEYSPDLRALAAQRFAAGGAEIRAADIRDRATLGAEPIDIALCQRVLINLLDPADQAAARDNIVDAVAPGGHLLFVESFTAGLDLLNEARGEFELAVIGAAHHNLYLGDDFFAVPALAPWAGPVDEVPEHFLSTHYYVTRVVHPLLLGQRPFRHNSLFTGFMSQALAQNVGAFSPIRARAFSRS